MTTKLILAQADTLQKAGLRIMVERGEVAVGSTDSGILITRHLLFSKSMGRRAWVHEPCLFLSLKLTLMLLVGVSLILP